MNGSKRRRRESTKGTIPGPRLFFGTNNLEGPRDENYSMRGYVHVLEDPEDAMFAMRQYVSEDVKAVKVYDGISIEVLRVVVREADRANIPVIGHFEDVRIAADAGAHGIEHNGAVANAIIDRQAREDALKKVRKGLDLPAESFMDLSKLPEIVELMVESGLYLNPTMRMSWTGDRALREKGFPV